MKIDWELLRQQKELLVNLTSDSNPLSEHDKGLIDGILQVLDTLQDEAVASGEFSEMEVFAEVRDE